MGNKRHWIYPAVAMGILLPLNKQALTQELYTLHAKLIAIIVIALFFYTIILILKSNKHG